MSVEEEAADDMMMCCCASCGKAEVDDVKLKKCACDLVKYCSVECQKNHRPQHKKACKKRMAEIKDGNLFTQPDESHLGECPICCLPLPLDTGKWKINPCCCKRICDGCALANVLREKEEELEHKCPFCREPVQKTDEEVDKNYMERVKANDPVALYEMGMKCCQKGDFEGACQYWTKAAAQGDADGHYNLSILYQLGEGVQKDLKKEMYHLEEAAIGGSPDARFNLACHEAMGGRNDRAVKHFIIAAKLGHDKALEKVKDGFAKGFVKKEDYETALRGHHAAVDATKSKQRDEAYALNNANK